MAEISRELTVALDELVDSRKPLAAAYEAHSDAVLEGRLTWEESAEVERRQGDVLTKAAGIAAGWEIER